MSDKFEVGNTVLAAGRVSTVEKVFKNGNFKVAGMDGQWRQGGYRAGDTGYSSVLCEHYTEAVAARLERRKLEVRLFNLLHDLGRHVNSVKALPDDDVKGAIEMLAPLLGKIEAANKA